MEERARRLALNESVFRDVNERLRDVNERFGFAVDDPEFVCECGEITCTERVRVPLREYERARSDELRFLVLPGHEAPELEDVVERRDEYHVVRKKGRAAAEVVRARHLLREGQGEG